MIEYKGYVGAFEFDDEIESFYGEVVNTKDVITFQGKSIAELKSALKDSIDHYLSFCATRGKTPHIIRKSTDNV